jgi:hypothetical protein
MKLLLQEIRRSRRDVRLRLRRRFCLAIPRGQFSRGQEMHGNSQFGKRARSHESLASDKKNRKDYVMRKSTATLTQQIDDSLPLWRRDVIPQRSPFIFSHAKQLAAIMAALGILFGLWFGIATYHAPRPGYPYYDTQKPVPTWSEPAPLEANRDRGGEYK